MAFIVAAMVCVLIAVLPAHQGYNLALWFFAARFLLLMVLALVAFIRQESLPADQETGHPAPAGPHAESHETGP